MDKLTIHTGGGGYVYDLEGKQYLDFTSGGIFQAPFGVSDIGMRSAILEGIGQHELDGVWHQQMISLYNAHYDNPAALRLVAMLKEMTGYESVVLFSTGSEAAEAYWRCMRTFTGKPNIWGGLVDPDDVGKEQAPPDAMHGMTLGSLIMAGRMTWPMLDPLNAFQGRYAQSAEGTCCAIWEPYHAPSAQFHKPFTTDRLKTLITTYPDIPHCSDEVQAGMGRTGKLFGYQWYDGLKPEFVILGKMLGGGLPLSALMGPKEILEDDTVVENAHLHSTHSGNPLMAAVGCYVLERIQSDDMIDYSFQMGKVLEDGLEGIKQRHHCGKGLLAGIEFEGPLMANMVVNACRRRGLLVVDTGRKWVKIGPQLNIKAEQIMGGCEILKRAIEEVENEIEAQRDTGEEPSEGSEPVREAGVEAVAVSGDADGSKDEG